MGNLAKILVDHQPRPTGDAKDAKEKMAKIRETYGLPAQAAMLLTSPDGNLKFSKSRNAVYGLSLAPARSSEVTNVCPFSTKECRKHCVAWSGRAATWDSVHLGRTWKTDFLLQFPDEFVTLLADELTRARRDYGRYLRVRLNTFSDLPWERITPELFDAKIKFYDYTKWPYDVRHDTPDNYRLTYSASEKTPVSEIRRLYKVGVNQAVVFNVPRTWTLPLEWEGMRVVDGDQSDDRWADPTPCLVGLRAKGTLRSVTSTFKRDPYAND